MVQQGQVTQQIFSVWFNRDPTSPLGGEIVFGGLDWRHFRGEHSYFPVTQLGYWQVQGMRLKFMLLVNFDSFNDSLSKDFTPDFLCKFSRLMWAIFL